MTAKPALKNTLGADQKTFRYCKWETSFYQRTLVMPIKRNSANGTGKIPFVKEYSRCWSFRCWHWENTLYQRILQMLIIPLLELGKYPLSKDTPDADHSAAGTGKLACIEGYSRNWTGKLACIEGYSRNWTGKLACIEGYSRNWTGKLACIEGYSRNWTGKLACIEGYSRNWTGKLSFITGHSRC